MMLDHRWNSHTNSALVYYDLKRIVVDTDSAWIVVAACYTHPPILA